MGFQNSINSALGAAGAAAAFGRHIINQNKELELKNAEAKEGLINTTDEAHILGNEFLTKEEAASVSDEKGNIKPDEALDLMGNKVANMLNEGSIEMVKGQEALIRMKQLRAARAKYKFTLGDKNAFDYQKEINNG